MTVYYMAVFTLDSERIENHIAYLLFVPELEIPPLLLDMCGGIVNEISFESRHLGFVERESPVRTTGTRRNRGHICVPLPKNHR